MGRGNEDENKNEIEIEIESAENQDPIQPFHAFHLSLS